MANKAALIKLSALDVVVVTANYSIEQGGIWIDGTAFASELKHKTTGEALPDLLSESACSFVPFSKVDWIMAPERQKRPEQER